MINEKSLPIVIIGGGGHASVLVDILLKQNRNIIAVISPENIYERSIFKGLTQLKNDDDILQFPIDAIRLVNGIGMLPKSGLRRRLNQYYLSLGYSFETVIAPEAIISPFATILLGAQIFPAAVIQAGANIGAHSIINTGAVIEHDCHIGEYNHIAPRVTMCGQVSTSTNVFIGANATIFNNTVIGENSVIGAGAVVKYNIV